jgi:hypothetical protein
MILTVGFRFLALVILFLGEHIQADPFEGYIYLQYYCAPIWVDVNIPTGDGPISGSYFYKHVGKPISLTGERRADTLHATETDSKGAVTGTFTCIIHRDSMVGTWVGPKEIHASRVLLFKAEPTDKKFSVLPKADKLKLATGGTLADRIKEYSSEDGSNNGSVEVGVCRKGIYSVSYYWEYDGGGDPPSSARISHTFDLASRKEIVLNSEIEPKRRREFYSRNHAKIQSELSALRKEHSDSEWIEALGNRMQKIPGSPDSALDKCFQLNGPCNTSVADYTFYENGLEYGFTDFFSFTANTRPWEFTSHITIPYAELKRDLRRKSRLLRLAP